MPFKNIRGLKIYYEIHGDGGKKGTIILLHHGSGCTKIWKEIYPRLVENGYRIIMYDRRGYGRSERGADFLEFYISDNYRPESVVELAALMDFLNIDSFHIIGQCEGGVVGADYAVKHPDQVQTLITSSTQCYSEKSVQQLNKQTFLKPFKDLEPDFKEKLIDWHGEYAEVFFNQFRRYGGAYGRNIFDLRKVLTSVMCPSLVLYPDRSSLFGVEQGVAFYRHLPKGELAVLPYCGHNTFEHRPEEFIRVVLEFLSRHDHCTGLSSKQL